MEIMYCKDGEGKPDNIHRGYVYTSAKYSEEKDRLIERYNNGNPDNLTYAELESRISEYDKIFQTEIISVKGKGGVHSRKHKRAE